MAETLWRTCAVAALRGVFGRQLARPAALQATISRSAGDAKGEEFIVGGLCGLTMPEEIAQTN